MESRALSVPLEASPLSCPISDLSSLSQDTDGPAVHSIHPDACTSPSKLHQPALPLSENSGCFVLMLLWQGRRAGGCPRTSDVYGGCQAQAHP